MAWNFTPAIRAFSRVNPKVVSERLGHASVGFTLDRSAHAKPDMQAEAAAIFAGLVFDPSSYGAATTSARSTSRAT